MAFRLCLSRAGEGRIALSKNFHLLDNLDKHHFDFAPSNLYQKWEIRHRYFLSLTSFEDRWIFFQGFLNRN